MVSIHLLLLIFACVAFGLATAGVPSRIGLLPLGLFLWSLSWFL